MINKKALVNTFIDLVKIDSPSGEEKKVAEYILRYLKKAKIKAGSDKYGNVIARLPGIGHPLMLNAHMDTVEPGRSIKPLIKGDVIKTDGRTILGGDNKAGVAVILAAAKYLTENKIKHRPLEIVFTRQEETGLQGANNLSAKKISSRQALVLDTGGPLGTINIASPYIYFIDIKIIGRSAHSGAEPEKGISAIQIAAKAISELKIGRIDRSTTNNIGIIAGGTAVNAVPEAVTIRAEARSHYLPKAQEQVDSINKAFKKYVRKYGAKLYFRSKLECQGYSYLTGDTFIKQIAMTNKKMGFKTMYKASGGGSDANVFAGKKIKAVVISYGGMNCHTVREMQKISDLVKLTKFIVEFTKK